MGYGQKTNVPNFTIKTIWGIAKSPELNLDDENLYAIIARETGKDSIRALNKKEIYKVCYVLSDMKDAANGKKKQKRTDIGGNLATADQRKKVYLLTKQLGWNDNNDRVNGFAKKMFKVERIEWLNPMQCSRLIEMLKQMIARIEKECTSSERMVSDEGND